MSTAHLPAPLRGRPGAGAVAAIVGVLAAVAAIVIVGFVLAGRIGEATVPASTGVPAPVAGTGSSAQVQSRLEKLRATIGSDLRGGVAPYEADIVRQVTVSDDGSVVRGTLALPADDGSCWGFEVRTDERWLVHGNAAGLAVSGVRSLPGEACTR